MKAVSAVSHRPLRRLSSFISRLTNRPREDVVVEATLRSTFATLADEWRRATALASSPTEIALHPAYQRIIGLGPGAISLILNELRQHPDQWFWALKAITGADPVRSEDRGNVRAMAAAWIAWGEQRGYL